MAHRSVKPSLIQCIAIASVFLAAALDAPITFAEGGGHARLRDVQDTFVKLAETLRPGVVALTGYKSATDENGKPSYYMFNDGTGFVWEPDGLIATNYHVIDGADRYEATLFDGTHYEAFLVGADPRSDLAVLRIEARNLTVHPFAAANRVKPGQWVVTLGNPLGFAGEDGNSAFFVGVVSAVGTSLTGRFGVESDSRNYDNMIQTTLDFVPGQSGGAVFNLDGEIIGIATARFAADDETPGVGFVIPLAQRTKCILEQLRRGETIRYGALGAKAETVNSSGAIAMTLLPPGGAMIAEVDYDSMNPIVRAGLRGRDVITQFADERIVDAATLARLCEALPVGVPFEVVYYRDGVQRVTTMTLADPRAQHRQNAEVIERWAFSRLPGETEAMPLKADGPTP